MTAEIQKILSTITDPEIPVLTIEDLGVLRSVIARDGEIEVIITPTYSGCPAMNMIEMNIKAALHQAGYQNVKITTVLSPPWTTDWLTESGKEKLKAYGIAPPATSTRKAALLGEDKPAECPQCQSPNTQLISEFGSTACKSLYKCLDCLEPFDYFKCH